MAYKRYIESPEIQKDLEKVILKDPNQYNRASAVKKLTNMEFLKKLAVNDPEALVRREAVMKIDDPLLVAKIAFHDPDIEVRKVATARIEDQEILKTLALTDVDFHIREMAIKRVIKNDIETIGKVAREDPVWMVRFAATWRIPNDERYKDLLCAIAEDESEEVRKAAVEHLLNQDALFVIWQKELSIKVRMVAVQRITDETILKQIYSQEEDPSIRELVVTKIEDQELLRKISVEDSAIWVREQAVYKLDKGQDEFMATIAMTDRDENIRALATRKIENAHVHCKIILDSMYSDSAMVAISRLDDPDLLVAMRLTARSNLQQSIQARLSELSDKN